MSKVFKKIKNKINDFFDVRKYRKRANTFENDANTVRKDYVEALETVQTLVIQNLNYQNQIKEQKKTIKDLKKTIEEDMIPKKKRAK